MEHALSAIPWFLCCRTFAKSHNISASRIKKVGFMTKGYKECLFEEF